MKRGLVAVLLAAVLPAAASMPSPGARCLAPVGAPVPHRTGWAATLPQAHAPRSCASRSQHSAAELRAEIAALKQEREALEQAESELRARQKVMEIMQERQAALTRDVLRFQRQLESHIRRSLSPPAEWKDDYQHAAAVSLGRLDHVQALAPVRGGTDTDTPPPLDALCWLPYVLVAAKSEAWAARAIAGKTQLRPEQACRAVGKDGQFGADD